MSLTLLAKNRDELNALVADYVARGGEIQVLPTRRASTWTRAEWRDAVRGEASLPDKRTDQVQVAAKDFMRKVLEAYRSGGIEAALALAS